MKKPPGKKTAPRSPAAPPEGSSIWQQFDMMRRAFVASPLLKPILWLTAGSFTVIVVTAIGQIILNRWYRPFFDAIERRDLNAFFYQLMLFLVIAGVLLVFNVTQQWLNQMVRLKLREGLTLDLIGQWMRPRRAFRLANAGTIGVNPDQRMQEDAGHLADLTTSLGFGLLQSSILLISFVGVLWSLSAGFAFQIGDRSLEIPGYMVWAAILYAGSASWLSWLVGRPLIHLNGERYAREADLRFSMMHANEHIDGISLAGGEAGERRRLELDLAAVLSAMRNIFRAEINLGWVQDGYGWVTVVAPILVAAPVYFAGNISFGGLMMAVGAFNQVHTSLKWFVANVSAITDWRATLLRVAAFRRALIVADTLHDKEKRIEFVENDRGSLTFDNLEVVSPSGRTRLAEPHIEIAVGQRVIISGDPRAGKTLLFRALAGLWPWGSGRVGLPADDDVAFIPRDPYFPRGRLRNALAYPRPEGFADSEIVAALSKVGLDHLATSLDREARWERELSDDDQRLLAFARLLLQRPRWVIIDEALETMDSDALKLALSIFETDLKETAVVKIGRTPRNGALFSRVIHLVKDAEGPALKPVPLDAGVPELEMAGSSAP
ncbi:putative ATP-binding cassette transporter [Sinorhizobium fredii]|uniref:Putative ABC transporter ATP-binding protein n=1 Tax=Sinorhizobium fredii (strain USDA 257) TaxID=1185652 RepID=I3X253_SINF2|nr:ABC transporter ATP-binding protein/permease [Sinorhizobium fredii]AFL49959.1 putative ABC transporter ATP-binding protein [Sinorhizobium fredii USDA 257]